MAEQGYAVMDIGWFAVIGRPRLPAENVSALAAAVEAIRGEGETRAALAKVGTRRWDKLIRERNITE